MTRTPNEHLADAANDVGRLLGLAGPRPALPADRAARMQAAFRARLVQEVSRRRRRIRAGIALAIAATLVIALGTALQVGRQESSPAGAALAEIVRVTGPVAAGAALAIGDTYYPGDRLATRPAGRAALLLANGTSVRLDVDTRVHFVSEDTVALESGTLYVDSGQDGNGSIAVQTDLGVVREIGTQFEVRFEPGLLKVRIREGEIRLERETGSLAGVALEEVTVHADGSVSRQSSSPYGPSWSWVIEIAPAPDLDGRGLLAYLEWVGRETGLAVRFTAPEVERSASTTRVHGPLNRATPQQSLAAVLEASELSYRIDDGVLWVGPSRSAE